MVKYNKSFKLALVFLSLMLSSISFAGGAWTQKKGKSFLKLSEFWIVFDKTFDTEGKVVDSNNDRGIYNTYLYGEYGFTDRLTGIFNGAIFSRSVIGASNIGTIQKKDQLNAVGDIDLALKYRLTSDNSPISVSASVLLGLPTGKVGGGDTKTLQTGDGEFNQMIQFDVGKGFTIGSNESGFLNAYVAFNNRTSTAENFGKRLGEGISISSEDDFSDEFRFGLEYGMTFFERKFWLISRIYGIESFNNSDLAIEGGSLFANNVEYTSFSFEGNYYFNQNFGVSASFGGAFSAKIVAAAPAYSLGIFLDFSK